EPMSFDEYKAFVAEYTLDKTAEMTGVPKDQLEQLAQLYADPNIYLYRLLAHRPPNALNTTLTRQDARYPVDAQLKTTLLAPLTAL
ncbi:hypothetical protein MJL33_31570, partial [Salmonella enterica subsp. enterica serovar Kentucky]|nr:hypothetical protein [Salmonella enterica subsp. enterica serovar Kentucky]